MGKLNVRPVPATVIQTAEPAIRILNHEGSPAYVRDPKSELFLLSVGGFFGEDKFYESASESSQRFRGLIHQVAKSDPEWTAKFLAWLRSAGNIRTAAVVGAAEYVRAGAPNGRTVVRSVLQRPDEPGEILAYWRNTHVRAIPKPLQRGVKDSVERMYSQRNLVKFDASGNAMRFGDVIEIVHPSPQSTEQSDLFKWAIDSRHNRDGEPTALGAIYARQLALKAEDPREALLQQMEKGNPTITWETVSSAAKGPMASTQWERLYMRMGYMARLRNLRNLDVAGVAPGPKRAIGALLADPVEVAKSKQLPMRFLSAYKAVNDLVWGSYLSEALDHSLSNVPQVPGNWLVLVDASGSMDMHLSKDSSMSMYEAAAVFGAAFAKRNNAVLQTYSNGLSPLVNIAKGESTLKVVGKMLGREYFFGGGTNTGPCLREAFSRSSYDRVLLLTDEQSYTGRWGSYTSAGDAIPQNVPLYTFNLAGYRSASDQSSPTRITLGGLSDASFGIISMLEKHRDGSWPWE
jgi:hypothetical protein